MRSLQLASCALLLSFGLACSSKPAEQPASTEPGAGGSAPASNSGTPTLATRPGTNKPETPRNETARPPAAAAAPLPAGTVVTVRLDHAVGTKTSHAGDEFTATVAEAVENNGAVVIPQGAAARGVVAEAVPKGRFKGASRLRLSLQSITVNGTAYPVETASVQRAAKGKGKRSATMIGGGAGLGALIGGLAGGGKGAAIGALAGAGAGTAGAAYTGNTDIVLPAETALSFKLLQPLDIKR